MWIILLRGKVWSYKWVFCMNEKERNIVDRMYDSIPEERFEWEDDGRGFASEDPVSELIPYAKCPRCGEFSVKVVKIEVLKRAFFGLFISDAVEEVDYEVVCDNCKMDYGFLFNE